MLRIHFKLQFVFFFHETLFIKKQSKRGSGKGSAGPSGRPGATKKEMSRSVSRVLSWTIIHLRPASPPACSDLPESAVGHSQWIPIWSCSGWGLPSPCLLPATRCALTAPFHPYPTEVGRYPFCCTFRRLTPPRCYLAPCPVEPGLSSPGRTGSDRLTDSAARLPAGTGAGKQNLSRDGAAAGNRRAPSCAGR